MYPAALNGTYFIALNANQSMVATAVNGSIFVEPMGSGGQQEVKFIQSLFILNNSAVKLQWSISPFFFGGNVSSYPILVPPISDSFGGGPGPERLGWVVEPNSTDIGLGGGSNDWIIREVDYINYVYQLVFIII